MRILGTLLLAAVLTPLLSACGGSDTVTIATVGNYHPFNFLDDAGEIDGLERELGDELCRRADLECAWIVREWETLIPALEAEEFDAILAGMSITAEREQRITFTEAYYPPTPSVYVARAGAGDAAAQGVIGVTANTIYSDYFTELGRPFVPLDHAREAVDAVLSGEVDAVLVDHGYAVEKLAAHAGQLAIVGPSVTLDRGLGIGVRQGSALKDTFDGALAAMKADGSLDALLRKWVGEEAATFTATRPAPATSPTAPAESTPVPDMPTLGPVTPAPATREARPAPTTLFDDSYDLGGQAATPGSYRRS